MTSDEQARRIGMAGTWKRHLGTLIRALASLKLAVALIVVLAVVIAVATVLETKHGRQYSQWFVYHSFWFIGLLGLLGASVFCAAYVRWPWKRRQTGFVITHAGLLVLLAGSILTLLSGIEGQVVLVEGQSTDQLTLNQRSQITAYWAERPHDPPYVFTFESGPVDWSPGTQLEIGSVDGVRARVLSYFHRGQAVEHWSTDDRQVGGPLVRFRLEGPHGGGRVEHFLADQDFGAEIFVGPIALRLQRAASGAMLADFLHPPDRELGGKGLLTMYYQDQVQRAPVDENVGKTLEVGHSGVTVELVHYLANAKLDSTGQFQPLGEEPRNPLVELRVHMPDENEPFRQVAFAKSPLLNLDGVYERVCPVKFVYQHPKIEPTAAIEFLQTSDGKLYGRTTAGGEQKAHGEVTTGSRLDVPGGFTLIVAEYLPHARRQISFKPAKENADDGQILEPAAEVEIAVAGVTDKVWIQRNNPEFPRGTIVTPDGPLHVQFSTAQIPLGFSLQLVDFHRETNPGQVGNAAYSSVVRLVDKERHVDDQRRISRNEPLTYKGFTFYQSGSHEAGHGKGASVFRVVYNPGGPMKYAGTWMILLGVATMFCMRAYLSNGLPCQLATTDAVIATPSSV